MYLCFREEWLFIKKNFTANPVKATYYVKPLGSISENLTRTKKLIVWITQISIFVDDTKLII